MKNRVRILTCGALVALGSTTPLGAQLARSVTCRFERIATAEVDSGGKLTTGGEGSSGEMVISNLESDAPVAVGNVGTTHLRVLKRTVDMVWLAEVTEQDVAGYITLFLKSGIIMYTKHETLHSASGEATRPLSSNGTETRHKATLRALW